MQYVLKHLNQKLKAEIFQIFNENGKFGIRETKTPFKMLTFPLKIEDMCCTKS